jgi:hypothetical protein
MKAELMAVVSTHKCGEESVFLKIKPQNVEVISGVSGCRSVILFGEYMVEIFSITGEYREGINFKLWVNDGFLFIKFDTEKEPVSIPINTTIRYMDLGIKLMHYKELWEVVKWNQN